MVLTCLPYKKLLKMAIEIVDFPMKNGGSFHSYVNVYQRVPVFRSKGSRAALLMMSRRVSPCKVVETGNKQGLSIDISQFLAEK